MEKERLLLEETLRAMMRNSKLPWWSVQVQPQEVERAIKQISLQHQMIFNQNTLNMAASGWLSVADTGFSRRGARNRVCGRVL